MPLAQLHPPKVRSLDITTMDEMRLIALSEKLGGQPVPGVRMSERAFLEWRPELITAEWVDGEVILMTPASDAHEKLDEWIGRLVGCYIEPDDLGELRRNMNVRFPGRRQVRVPDMLYIATENLKRIKSTYIDGPPDLIIEIVSPDSVDRDRRPKFAEYQAAGVREYWIVDPLAKTLDVFILRGRKYHRIRVEDDRVASVVLPGFYLRAAWLFGARPKVFDVLREFARTRR